MKTIRYIVISILLLSIVQIPVAAGTTSVFHRSSAPEELYVVDLHGKPGPWKHLAAIVQGMANRESPVLYLVGAGPVGADRIWLDYFGSEYSVKEAGTLTLEQAVEKFSGLFTGYAVFSMDEGWTVAAADTYCAVRDCLPVTPEQEGLAGRAGLEKIEDFRGRWKSAAGAAMWTFRNLYPECSKKALAVLFPDRHSLRDYLYANRIYTCSLGAAGGEFVLLKKIMDRTPENIPVMGYIARDALEELKSQVALAERGKFLVASGGTANLSVHSGIPRLPLPEFDQWGEPPDIGGKLGVVFAFSDGDNTRYQASYYLQDRFWLNTARGQAKVAWSVSPELAELAPAMMRYYYQSRTENDFFAVLGGAGYTHPSKYSDPDFFGALTVDYMRECGLDLLWTLDPQVYFTGSRTILGNFFRPFGGDTFLRGLMVGYTPTGLDRNWRVEPGLPPLLYSKTDYDTTTPESIVETIEQEAREAGPDGEIFFFGVNGWTIGYDNILEIQEKFRGSEDVVFLSPQEAFSIIEARRGE